MEIEVLLPRERGVRESILARSCRAGVPCRLFLGVLAPLAALALVACGERSTQPQPSAAAKVVGVPPAPPTPDPPTVKAVAPRTSEMAKEVEIAAMPLPGQADDPETLAVLNSERSEAIDVLKDPELAKIANSDAALEIWRQKQLRRAQVDQLQRSRRAHAKGPAPP